MDDGVLQLAILRTWSVQRRNHASLGEVHQLNPVNPLEDRWDPEKVHSFSEPWRSPGIV
jgi:hypothetical protein